MSTFIRGLLLAGSFAATLEECPDVTLEAEANGLLPCPAPRGVDNAADVPCLEGCVISPGSLCTVQCKYGYESNRETLACFDRVLEPQEFDCSPICIIPEVEHSFNGRFCVEGPNNIIGNSALCTPYCSQGYYPVVRKWELVLQYGGAAYTPTAEAVARVDENFAYGLFAKLSDEYLNNNELFQDSDDEFDYFAIESETDSHHSTLLLRVPNRAFSDDSPNFGWGNNWSVCDVPDATKEDFEDCNWLRAGDCDHLDTLCVSEYQNGCRQRWVVDADGMVGCLDESSGVDNAGKRCVSGNFDCDGDALTIRTRVKMYKLINGVPKLTCNSGTLAQSVHVGMIQSTRLDPGALF